MSIIPSLSPKERYHLTVQGRETDRPPIWIMRQAGRYMPEYRALRSRHAFLDFCHKPEVSAEATLMPLDILGIDLLIIFNDILIPLQDMGLELDFPTGGPVIANPVRTMEAVERLARPNFERAAVARSLQLVKEGAPGVPVLGFCGAPFTLAVYAVEGRVKTDKGVVMTMTDEAPGVLEALLDRLTDAVVDYLSLQVLRGGADGVQVFESWGGLLETPEAYERFAGRWQRELIRRFRLQCPETPVHLYLRGSEGKIPAMEASGADVLSVDWNTSLAKARSLTNRALQGNLDPEILLDPDAVAPAFARMIEGFDWRRGWIANLGHGITPKASVEAARRFVQCVHDLARHGSPECTPSKNSA